MYYNNLVKLTKSEDINNSDFKYILEKIEQILYCSGESVDEPTLGIPALKIKIKGYSVNELEEERKESYTLYFNNSQHYSLSIYDGAHQKMNGYLFTSFSPDVIEFSQGDFRWDNTSESIILKRGIWNGIFLFMSNEGEIYCNLDEGSTYKSRSATSDYLIPKVYIHEIFNAGYETNIVGDTPIVLFDSENSQGRQAYLNSEEDWQITDNLYPRGHDITLPYFIYGERYVPGNFTIGIKDYTKIKFTPCIKIHTSEDHFSEDDVIYPVGMGNIYYTPIGMNRLNGKFYFIDHLGEIFTVSDWFSSEK